ncbi:MAG: hypothetical protein R3B06_18820 [Kofleriaceae bacterium]
MIDPWAERTLCDDGACTGVVDPQTGLCGTCGRMLPLWGNERLRGQVADAIDRDDAPADAGQGAVDDARALCPDGACIGVIGDDGACRVCGRRPVTRVVPPAIAADPGAGTADADADEDDDRRLCPDGACVGLLDADGVCRVCGATDAGN